MLDWIEEIVALGIRRPGSPADLAVENYLREKFCQFQLAQVHTEPVPVHYWDPAETEVLLLGPEAAGSARPIGSFAVPFTAWTPSRGIEAPSVYLAGGTRSDFDAVDFRVELPQGEFEAAIDVFAQLFTHFEVPTRNQQLHEGLLDSEMVHR